jgi:hypothetical protein
MSQTSFALKPVLAAVFIVGLVPSVEAAKVQVQVTVENPAPQGSVSFAPLLVRFNGGTFITELC